MKSQEKFEINPNSKSIWNKWLGGVAVAPNMSSVHRICAIRQEIALFIMDLTPKCVVCTIHCALDRPPIGLWKWVCGILTHQTCPIYDWRWHLIGNPKRLQMIVNGLSTYQMCPLLVPVTTPDKALKEAFNYAHRPVYPLDVCDEALVSTRHWPPTHVSPIFGGDAVATRHWPPIHVCCMCMSRPRTLQLYQGPPPLRT